MITDGQQLSIFGIRRYFLCLIIRAGNNITCTGKLSHDTIHYTLHTFHSNLYYWACTCTQVSKQLVRERMERENPEDVAILDNVKDTDIVCVRGTFDHIHLVLEAIGVPFSHVDPSSLLRMELKPEQTVYVNCPSSFPKEAALKLRKFVEEGGQLITTDWALKNVLEVAFPGTVRFSGNSTGDEVVAVEIVDKEDEILKGIVVKGLSVIWIGYMNVMMYQLRSRNTSLFRAL